MCKAFSVNVEVDLATTGAFFSASSWAVKHSGYVVGPGHDDDDKDNNNN